jgi:hypothetical protein
MPQRPKTAIGSQPKSLGLSQKVVNTMTSNLKSKQSTDIKFSQMSKTGRLSSAGSSSIGKRQSLSG